MTKKELEKTEWAKEFKKVDFRNYPFALDYALRNPLYVEINKTDENGENVWAISIGNFWMDAKKTKKESVALCKKMGWKITG